MEACVLLNATSVRDCPKVAVDIITYDTRISAKNDLPGLTEKTADSYVNDSATASGSRKESCDV